MAAPKPPTLYFGYGSNLWIDQMNRRCPENKLVGIGSIQGWKWIINGRGYANIVPSLGDVVYGLVYEISETDEANLDISEGVPRAYVKEIMSIDFIPRRDAHSDHPQLVNTHQPRKIDALVYVDFKRVKESKPKEEYIYRINQGIVDGEKEGIPSDYFEKYFRPFIPAINLDKKPDVLDPFAPELSRTET
ncbi:hypothetical protein H1R20_g7115, partial [Candolleomyces eurysporus]